MLRWLLRIFGGLLLLMLIAVVGVWLWKPWVPPLQMAEPGETGRRVDAGPVLGNYFPGPKGTKRPGVLVLGGSEGGLGNGMMRAAKVLQQSGFTVLQLSYYRGPGQPEELELVPLETMYAGLDWLRKQPEVDAERVGIVGASKGAEAALLVATRRPDIRAVAVGVPSSVVWTGIRWSTGGAGGQSSWSFEGKPLPALPYGPFDWEVGVLSVYLGGLKKLAEHPETIIPVEKTDAAVLLICGERDTLWPSCPMARQVQERAKEKGGPKVELLAYADAGHAAFGVPIARDHPNFERLGGLGGTAEGNAQAREESWPALIDFLRGQLTSTLFKTK